MRIDIRNAQRQPLFVAEVDSGDPPAVVTPAGADEPKVYLKWEQAVDDHGHLRRCPVCGCRETFVRKDFPQVTGFVVVVLAAVVAMVLFGAGQVLYGFVVLGAVALIDAAVFLFTGRCVVCYRCRSEYRKLPIRRDHPKWELATGEKYRLVEPDVDDTMSEGGAPAPPTSASASHPRARHE